ncbi:YebC/PmpR family DNA-binding transcriptional regulator [Candidatus Margulisiibacteriota bacterium]
MSGHSKWSTIKRKKGKTDAARGKAFTKVVREIAAAVKSGGGGDPSGNPRLRMAIDKAKEINMPNDNIERAIKKASGGGEGTILDEVVYEGYGPNGVAMMVEAITDNKQRTVSEIRNAFSKHGGNLGETGCVSWMFKKKGLISFEKGKVDEEKLMSSAIEAGAEDIKTEESMVVVETLPEKMEGVRDSLKAEFEVASSEVSMVPQNTVHMEAEDAHKILKLIGALEESDDVQNVHANFDIPDEIMNQEASD